MAIEQFWTTISDRSQVGEARRQVNRLTENSSWRDEDRGRAAIVVSELATNLERYASEGELFLRCVSEDDDVSYLEIHSIDRGPGFENFSNSITDGFSTGGTPGTGLGAVQRLTSSFDVFTTAPGGTVIYCRVTAGQRPRVPKSAYSWGAICKPMARETICGDAWRISATGTKLAIFVADGLGHGPEASVAAEQAVEVFSLDPFAPLEMMFENAHSRMRGTRGGAAAAAQIDVARDVIKYVGVGNIAGSLRDSNGGPGKGLVSHNGTLGVQVRKTQVFDYERPADGLLIMHSDGLQGRWNLDAYPGLIGRHPAVIAAMLYRDFNRGRDDVTVAVVRFRPAEEVTDGRA